MGFATIKIDAPENVGRALAAMNFAALDDYAAGVIVRSEVLQAGRDVQALTEAAGDMSSADVTAAAQRLLGCAKALKELGL